MKCKVHVEDVNGEIINLGDKVKFIKDVYYIKHPNCRDCFSYDAPSVEEFYVDEIIITRDQRVLLNSHKDIRYCADSCVVVHSKEDICFEY